MFYGAKPITFEKAKALRAKMTEAEMVLWEHLKNKQINGLRFRKQHPINIFIADFYCHKIKLVIEVDGGVHNNIENKEWDENRTAEMENFGITLIRFTNHKVLNNIEKTIDEIKRICGELLAQESPLSGGFGEHCMECFDSFIGSK